MAVRKTIIEVPEKKTVNKYNEPRSPLVTDPQVIEAKGWSPSVTDSASTKLMDTSVANFTIVFLVYIILFVLLLIVFNKLFLQLDDFPTPKTSSISEFYDKFLELVTFLITSLADFIEKLCVFILDIADRLENKVKIALIAISAVIFGLILIVKTTIGTFLYIVNLPIEILSYFLGVVQDIWTSITSCLGEAVERIQTLVANTWCVLLEIGTIFNNFFSKMGHSLKNMIKISYNVFINQAKKGIDALGVVLEKLFKKSPKGWSPSVTEPEQPKTSTCSSESPSSSQSTSDEDDNISNTEVEPPSGTENLNLEGWSPSVTEEMIEEQIVQGWSPSVTESAVSEDLIQLSSPGSSGIEKQIVQGWSPSVTESVVSEDLIQLSSPGSSGEFELTNKCTNNDTQGCSPSVTGSSLGSSLEFDVTKRSTDDSTPKFPNRPVTPFKELVDLPGEVECAQTKGLSRNKSFSDYTGYRDYDPISAIKDQVKRRSYSFEERLLDATPQPPANSSTDESSPLSQSERRSRDMKMALEVKKLFDDISRRADKQMAKAQSVSAPASPSESRPTTPQSQSSSDLGSTSATKDNTQNLVSDVIEKVGPYSGQVQNFIKKAPK